MRTPPVNGLGSGGKAPLLPNLVVKLGPDWRYVASKNAFVSSDGEEFQPMQELPHGTRIEHMVPNLVARDEPQLTEDELKLARYIHVVFPAGTAPEEHSATVNDWPCVDEVRLPPDISLP